MLKIEINIFIEIYFDEKLFTHEENGKQANERMNIKAVKHFKRLNDMFPHIYERVRSDVAERFHAIKKMTKNLSYFRKHRKDFRIPENFMSFKTTFLFKGMSCRIDFMLFT